MRRTVLCGRTFAGLMAVTAAERGVGGVGGWVAGRGGHAPVARKLRRQDRRSRAAQSHSVLL